ncbi:MAG: CBS domain-containing protein [Planctomycetaceae bacterium]|nr:CBS domain-containing protein [Planctomycetaceae bacterium]
MTVQDLLNGKGNAVYTIRPKSSLGEAVERLVEYNVGSLMVAEPGEARPDGSPGDLRLYGIITERDVLRAVASFQEPLTTLEVREVMSSRLVTGQLHDSVEHVMGLMTERRIRHLPILHEGRLVGLISIGDVVKTQHQQMAMENHYLKNYIQSW